MIARIWHGWTRPENADRYEELLRTEILPEIAARDIPGYRGPHLFRRVHPTGRAPDPETGEVEFVTVLWFDSLDAVRAFQGTDFETAHVPVVAREVLERFDARSRHYDVLLTPETLPPGGR